MEKVVRTFLEELGINTQLVDEEQETRVRQWLDVYKGKTKEHTYYVYNGKKRTKQTLKSLNLASQSCSDLSDFFFNEKLDITIDKENVENSIKDCLKQNDFLRNANNLMQITEALGTGAFVPYLDNDVLRINYLNATNIIILESDKGHIKSVLFWSKEKVLNGNEIKINCHILTEEGYVIHNRKYLEKDGNITEEQLEDNVRTIETKSFIPKFAIITTPIINNIDINSPYGISCYANAIDTLISIDRTFDTYDNEIWLGRKRVYVKGGAAKFNVNESGELTPVFDSSETTYYQLPGEEKDPLITVDTNELRIEAIKTALQGQLNIWSSKIGLGHNYYKFQEGQNYVNTDNIISSNSDVYRKIKKQENILTSALEDLIYAIAELIGIKEEFDISVFYDDSIIEDTNAIRIQAASEYNNKLISKAEYYRTVYKLGDKEALDFAKQMNEEIIAETITDGTEFSITE